MGDYFLNKIKSCLSPYKGFLGPLAAGLGKWAENFYQSWCFWRMGVTQSCTVYRYRYVLGANSKKGWRDGIKKQELFGHFFVYVSELRETGPKIDVMLLKG